MFVLVVFQTRHTLKCLFDGFIPKTDFIFVVRNATLQGLSGLYSLQHDTLCAWTLEVIKCWSSASRTTIRGQGLNTFTTLSRYRARLTQTSHLPLLYPVLIRKIQGRVMRPRCAQIDLSICTKLSDMEIERHLYALCSNVSAHNTPWLKEGEQVHVDPHTEDNALHNFH